MSFYRNCPPRRLSHEVDDAQLLTLWNGGHDTYEIATLLSIPEFEVANRLPKIREAARQQHEWDAIA